MWLTLLLAHLSYHMIILQVPLFVHKPQLKPTILICIKLPHQFPEARLNTSHLLVCSQALPYIHKQHKHIMLHHNITQELSTDIFGQVHKNRVELGEKLWRRKRSDFCAAAEIFIAKKIRTVLEWRLFFSPSRGRVSRNKVRVDATTHRTCLSRQGAPHFLWGCCWHTHHIFVPWRVNMC